MNPTALMLEALVKIIEERLNIIVNNLQLKRISQEIAYHHVNEIYIIVSNTINNDAFSGYAYIFENVRDRAETLKSLYS